MRTFKEPTNHEDSFRLRLLLTDGCNLNCPYCLNDFQTKPIGEPSFLDRGRMQKVVSEYLNGAEFHHYQPEVYLSGGEPTTHPQILNFIEDIENIASHYKTKKLRIVVCTNGKIKIRLREKLKKLQKKYRNISFTVSLHKGHRPSIKWCHEVKSNYSIVMRSYPKKEKEIVDSIGIQFARIYSMMRTSMLRLYEMGWIVSNKQYFYGGCKVKILDDFNNPDPKTYEERFERYKRRIHEIRKNCVVEPRPYKASNCSGCDEICCSHRSYWVRPDGTSSHCPKFKEEYSDIDITHAYWKHQSKAIVETTEWEEDPEDIQILFNERSIALRSMSLSPMAFIDEANLLDSLLIKPIGIVGRTSGYEYFDTENTESLPLLHKKHVPCRPGELFGMLRFGREEVIDIEQTIEIPKLNPWTDKVEKVRKKQRRRIH